MRWAFGQWQAWFRSIDSINRRALAVAVLSHARILHTLAIGEVSSKRTAGEWALEAARPAVDIPHPLGTRRPPRSLDEGAPSPLTPATSAARGQFIDYAARLAAER